MISLAIAGVVVIFTGFLLILAGVVMSGRRSEGEERRNGVKGGGVIMIGPIPIIFGSDAKWASIAIVLAIALVLLVLVAGVLMGR